MSKLCSLPWCRKPILSRKHSKNFPSDRPSQLAWLDALDAGGWFSIPQETLATGLILCSDHFDAKREVKGRYDPPATHCPDPDPVIKVEPQGNSDSEESGEDAEDEDYSPTPTRTSSRKRPQPIRVNIIHHKRSRPESILPNSEDQDDEDEDNNQQGTPNLRATPHRSTYLDSIDSKKLSKLTEDAIKASHKSKDPTSTPQQRTSISLIQKMEIIRLADTGLKQSQIGKKCNISRSTVWSVLSRREKIEEAYNDGAPLRKKVRKGMFDDVNNALYAWYQKVKSQNLFVNTRVLITMAENIALELGRKDFKSSQGWLENFKKRHNIRLGNPSKKPKKKLQKANIVNSVASELGAGTDLFNEEEDLESLLKCEANLFELTNEDDELLKKDWIQSMWSHCRLKDPKTQEVYQDKDIFFAEETGILYRVTPKQAWQFKYGTNAQEFSIADERLTALICCNSDGSEKRKLLLAGRYEPGIPENLPADYVVTNDPSNWITKPILMRWLKQWNAVLKSDNRKIILLLSASPLHTFQADIIRNIKIVSIPTQALTIVHPVNYGIRSSFKARYRRLLLEKLIHNGEPISCRDAAFLLSTAWNELPVKLIREAFTATGYIGSNSKINVNEQMEEMDCSDLLSKAVEMGLAVPQSKYTFHDYVGIDDTLCAVECSMLQQNPEIDKSSNSRSEVDLDKEDYDDQCLNGGNFERMPVTSDLTSSDAQSHLSSLRTWAMSRQTCPQEVHNALSTLESFILGHS